MTRKAETDPEPAEQLRHGSANKTYVQSSVKKRIEALFLDNLGMVLTRAQIQSVAKDPKTNKEPENWHQRLSELRTHDGYTILSWRNRGDLKVEEYLMPDAQKRSSAGERIKPTKETWKHVIERCGGQCEWNEAGQRCLLKHGDVDQVGGGRVTLTADHKRPHSMNAASDPKDPNQWQALCGRHQVIKKNYWDSNTGKLNVYAIVQAASKKDKLLVFMFLIEHFGYVYESGRILKREKHIESNEP